MIASSIRYARIWENWDLRMITDILADTGEGGFCTGSFGGCKNDTWREMRVIETRIARHK